MEEKKDLSKYYTESYAEYQKYLEEVLGDEPPKETDKEKQECSKTSDQD